MPNFVQVSHRQQRERTRRVLGRAASPTTLGRRRENPSGLVLSGFWIPLQSSKARWSSPPFTGYFAVSETAKQPLEPVEFGVIVIVEKDNTVASDEGEVGVSTA